MNFDLNDEQRQMADGLERLLQDTYGFEHRRTIAASTQGWSEASWERLSQMGLTAIGIPEAWRASRATHAAIRSIQTHQPVTLEGN